MRTFTKLFAFSALLSSAAMVQAKDSDPEVLQELYKDSVQCAAAGTAAILITHQSVLIDENDEIYVDIEALSKVYTSFSKLLGDRMEKPTEEQEADLKQAFATIFRGSDDNDEEAFKRTWARILERLESCARAAGQQVEGTISEIEE